MIEIKIKYVNENDTIFKPQIKTEPNQTNSIFKRVCTKRKPIQFAHTADRIVRFGQTMHTHTSSLGLGSETEQNHHKSCNFHGEKLQCCNFL